MNTEEAMTVSSEIDYGLDWGAVGPSGRVWVPNPVDNPDLSTDEVETLVRSFARDSGMTLVARRSGDATWEPACLCGHAFEQHDEPGNCDFEGEDTGEPRHCGGFAPARAVNIVATQEPTP